MKTSSKKNIWGHLWQLVIPHKKRFALVVFIGLLATGANLIEPLIYREAINDVAGLFVSQAKHDTRAEYDDQEDDPITSAIEKHLAPEKKTKEPHGKGHVAERSPGQALETLLWAVALIFTVNVIGYLLSLIGENMNVRLACTAEQQFIQNTFSHVLKLPLGFFSMRSSAAVAKQINQSEEVSGIINGFSQEILPEIISLVGILIIMLYQNITLSLLALAIIPFYLLIAWRSSNKLEASLSSYYDRWEDVASRMHDSIAGIKTVKLSGAESREVNRLKNIAGAAYEDYVDRTKLANKYAFWQNTLTQVSSALVLAYGGYLTLEHKLTPGDVVMFVSYLDRLYYPIDNLTSLWVNLQQNAASVLRAFRLLDGSIEEKGGAPLRIEKGNVEFRDVHFSYQPGREVLQGISFHVKAGRVTALVGISGAGKTTIVDLLLKLYSPASGSIFIDGQDVAAHDSAFIRSQVGMVSADGNVFRGSLADNIRYKRPHATNAEVLTAAISAGLEGTLKRLPEGLETVVGEGGIGLSVGERQRIQIARILVSQPRILVLDEATANLDFAAEAEIKKTIESVRKQNTVIIIAHRYSMVRDADHVIVLAAGKVAEQGTPQELIARGGWFASFSNSADDENRQLSVQEVDAKEREAEDDDNEIETQ
jgi:ATP-binding cassette, subfamily B, bacterial